MLGDASPKRYVTEANTVSVSSSNINSITNGIIACNRSGDNNAIFISFASFEQQMDSGCVYFINGKFVWNKKPNNDVNNILEQEVFVSFQCNVLSAPVVEGDNIMFKSQAIEFNEKNHTEIPITCICSTQNSRIYGKVNKLQKGNKIDIMGNLTKNDEEITVLVNYIVYVNNTINFSSMEKKDLSKIPWLNSSGLKTT
ncbi:10772_t:CDS:2, partial [Funneliformis caledonium]